MNVTDNAERRVARAILLTFAALAAILISIGYVTFQHYTTKFKIEADRQLSAISALKVAELAEWRQLRMRDATFFYHDAIFHDLVRRYFGQPEDTNAGNSLSRGMKIFQETYKYDKMQLFDAQGLERLASPQGQPASSGVTKRVIEVMRLGKPEFMDFFRSDQDGRIYLALIVPILGEQPADSSPLGALVMRIVPEQYLYPFLSRWPTPSATAETLLIRRDDDQIAFLNPLKYYPNAALLLRLPLEDARLPSVMAALGQEGIVEGVDYRGQPVIAAVSAVPASPWFMVARMDVSELYAPLRERVWMTAALMAALLAVAGLGLGWIWREQHLRCKAESARIDRALEGERRFREIFSAHSAVMLLINAPAGTILDANPAAQRFYGYPLAQLIGMSINALNTLPIEVHAAYRRQALQGEQSFFSMRHRLADGSIRDVDVHSSPISLGGEQTLFSIIFDVTARKQVEQALIESEDLFRTAFENAPYGMALLDLSGRILRVNAALCAIFGYDEAALLHHSFAALTHPEDLAASLDFFQGVVEGKKPHSWIEKRYVRNDGSTIWTLLSTAAVRNAHGQVTGLVSQVQDISERKSAEELRDVVERIVRHDLRSPAGSAVAVARILAESPTLSGEDREMVELLECSGQRMLDTLNQSLDLFNIETGQYRCVPQSIDALALLREIAAALLLLPQHEGRRIDIRSNGLAPADASSSPLTGDFSLMRAALHNLVQNALEASAPEDTVVVDLTTLDNGTRRWRIEIRNQGVVPQNIRNRFFEKYATSGKAKGTGLGAYSAKMMIEAQGGVIAMHTSDEKGQTSILVDLPA